MATPEPNSKKVEKEPEIVIIDVTKDDSKVESEEPAAKKGQRAKGNATAAQKVLSTRELLEQIFQVFVAAQDTQTLLIARKVCRTWRTECYSALCKLRHVLPIIVCENEKGYRKPTLDTFLQKLPVKCSIPLSIVIREWSQQVVYCLNTFYKEIVSVTLEIGDQWNGFGGKVPEFHLPGLKDSVLSLKYRYTEYPPLTEADIKDVFTFWYTLTGNALRILKCELSIEHMKTEFAHSCIQFPPSLNHLTFDMNINPLMKDLAKETTFWPNLEKVSIRNLNPQLEEPLLFQFFSNHRSTLQTLEISGNVGEQTIRLTRMDSLKEIVIKGPVIYFESERLPISTLLPKLTAILGMKDATMRSLTMRGTSFENVISVDYFQGVDNRLEAAKMMLHFIDYFPNVKVLNLEWHSARIAAAALPIVYKHLSNLESLGFAVTEITSYCDINRLITGLTVCDLTPAPDYPYWRTLLDGKTNAVTNLKKLKQFKVVWRRDKRMDWSGRAYIWEAFVFTAAFFRMASLQKLHFVNLNVQGRDTFITQWKKLGKEIVLNGR